MPIPSIPNSSEKKVNWEVAKSCLAELNREAPSILQQGVIIGGIACWFYRHLLSKAQDTDFKVPIFSAVQEQCWLSKDIDFTNFFAQDARDLLKEHIVADAQGRLHLRIAGVAIGFAQVGITFDPELAWAESWIGTFSSGETTVQCRILDPITLYREKLALSQKRGSESDHLHCALVAEYLRCQVCEQVESLVTAKTLEARTPALKFLLAIRDRALEVCQDKRVHSRIQAALGGTNALAPSESKLITDISEFPAPQQTPSG